MNAIRFGGRMTMGAALLAAALALAACDQGGESEPVSGTVPTEQPDQLKPVELRALQLYQRYLAHQLALEALTAQQINPYESRGFISWVADPEGTDWRVRFIARDEAGFYRHRSVILHPDATAEIDKGPGTGKGAGGPGGEAPERQYIDGAALVQARAIDAVFKSGEPSPLCTQRLVPVALPPGEDGKTVRVYGIGLPQAETDVVVGGHHSFLYNQTKGRIVESRALAENCHTLEIQPDAERIDYEVTRKGGGVAVADVFLNLLHGKPVRAVVRDAGAGEDAEPQTFLIRDGRVQSAVQRDGGGSGAASGDNGEADGG